MARAICVQGAACLPCTRKTAKGATTPSKFEKAASRPNIRTRSSFVVPSLIQNLDTKGEVKNARRPEEHRTGHHSRDHDRAEEVVNADVQIGHRKERQGGHLDLFACVEPSRSPPWNKGRRR